MFTESIAEILGKRKCMAYSSAWQVLDGWRQFYELCNEGYEMGLYEYDNEISIRGLIEEILNSKELYEYEEYSKFRSEVLIVDEKLRSLFSNIHERQDKKYWWEKGILNNASEEYNVDIQNRYKIKIS